MLMLKIILFYYSFGSIIIKYWYFDHIYINIWFLDILLDKFDDGISKQLFKNEFVNQGRKPTGMTGMSYSKEIKEFALTLSYYKALTYCRYLMLMLVIAYCTTAFLY